MKRTKWDYLHWLLAGSVCAYLGIAAAACVLLTREDVRIEYLLLLAGLVGGVLYLIVTLATDAGDRDDE